MVRCFVFGCRSNALRIKGCKMKYFSFPKNMRLAKLWREACGRKKSSKNARICSQHFSASSFKSLSQQDLRKNTSTSLRTLKVDAIPTLHLPKIIYVQKSKKLPALKNKSTESVAICENVGGENISDGNEKHLNLEQSSIEKIAVDAFEKGMESEVNFEENEILESVTALMEGVELGKVCRACLGTEGPMKKMFAPQKQTLISSYSHVLSICIGLQVDPDHGFPALLCSPCCSFLESFSSFRKQARCVSACLSKMCRKGCAVKNEESNTKKLGTADDSQTEACGEEGFVLLVGDDSSLATGFENYFKIDDGVASAQIRNKANVKKEITSEDGVKEESACEDAVGDHEDAGETKKEAVDDYESGDESWNEGDDAEVTAKTKRATLRGAIKAVTFPCRKCERHFLSWPELSEHNQSHDQATATADSVCRYCQITFRHPRFVYSHIVKVHPDEDRFQCGHCDVRFSSHKLLRIHMHRHQDTQPPEEAETNHVVSEKEELDTYNDSDSNDQVLAYIKKQNDTNKGLLQLRDKTKVFQDKIAEKKSKTGKKSTRVACSLCDKVFRQTALSRHMATHDPDKPFYCKVGRCKWSFSTEHDLAVHGMVNHSDPAEDASLVCLFCRKAFSGRRNLRQHMLQHKPSKRFNCSFCAKGFNFIHHLQNHERIHTREQPFLCTECGLAFTTSDGLASHTRNKHIWEKPLTCEHCQKKFSDKTRLRIHMETHNNSDKFMCSECGKIFNKSSNLKKHVSNVHQRCLQNNRQRYSCDVCGDVSHNMQQLSRHMAVHTCKYFCHHCLKSFSIPSALDKHLKTHFEGDRSHVCNVCGAAFNRPDHLRGHTSRLHSAGSRPLSCAHCGRGFVRAQDLAEHTRIHTGEKPFKCKVCGKSYARGRALKIHERAHTGELPYICGVCHAGYKCAPGLASHMLTHSTPITHMNEIEGEDTKDFERSTSSIHISYTEVA